MENKITKILDSIINIEADQFTDEGLVFSGFSIPKEISKRNECFKGWSQTFSMAKATKNAENVNQFVKIINSIDHQILLDIYNNKISENDLNVDSLDVLKDLELVSFLKNELHLTDKGICYLTVFLSLEKTIANKYE